MIFLKLRRKFQLGKQVNNGGPDALAKGTFVMTAGMGLRAIAQAGVFLIVARVLGVEHYGAYAAILAIATTIGHFGGLGTHVLMMRDVSRNSNCLAEVWGRNLAVITFSTPLMLLAYLFIAWLLLPESISWIVILIIGLAEIVFVPLITSCVSLYQGCKRLGRAARLLFTSVLPRLVGAILLLPFAALISLENSLLVWGAVYFLATLVSAVYSLLLIRRDLGLSFKMETRDLVRYGREGAAYALGGAALKIYADIDKAMLARFSSLESAGAYSAGYRIMDFAQVPLIAFLSAALPRFFEVGRDDFGYFFRYGWRLVFIPLAYAVLVGSVMYVCAPLLPQVLGASYDSAITTLRWIAWLPVISMPRLLLQYMLTGADQAKRVVSVLGMGALLNVLLNLLFIPIWSWYGAVVATYVSEIVMTILMFKFALQLNGHRKVQ